MAIPLNIGLGRFAPSGEFRELVDLDTSQLRIEESGTFEASTCSFRLRDKNLAYTAMRGGWHLQVVWRPTGELLFRGLVNAPSRQSVVREHGIDITADDMSTLLDRLVITNKGIVRNEESLKARVAWLFGSMRNGAGSAWSGTVVAQPMLDAGFNYTTHVQNLDPNLPRQTFPPNLTLRQALERILSTVNNGSGPNSANYYVAWPYLHVYDDDNPETSRTAPYDINETAAPSGTEVAPENMVVDWDATRLINAYYVRGRNAAGSGLYTDQDLLSGPWSVNLFGFRSAYLDGPDCDTASKARRLARAALRDTRNPIARISLELTSEAKVMNGSKRWQGGQLVYITSAPHGLNGSGSDAGPWAGSYALQPFRVARVTTTLLSGGGERKVELEIGARRRRPMYTGG